MAGKGWMGVRIGSWTGIWVGLLACSGAPATFAADCPGHPDAIGTSRTISHAGPKLRLMKSDTSLRENNTALAIRAFVQQNFWSSRPIM